MLFTEYLDSVENTDKEARLFEEINKLKSDLEQATSVPVVGKLITSLIALGDSGSIEAFKQTEHYHSFEGWDVLIDLDKGIFSIYPGAEFRKKIFGVLAVIGVVVFFVWLYRRAKCKPTIEI